MYYFKGVVGLLLLVLFLGGWLCREHEKNVNGVGFFCGFFFLEGELVMQRT